VIFTKVPGATLDYTIDWNDGYLVSAETISSSSWSVQPVAVGGVVEDSSTNDTETATITISGGNHGKLYRLRNTITTSEGRTDTRTVYVLAWEPR